MTTPRVTELPLRLKPVEPDPFIEGLSRPAVRPRLTERQERERRVDLVRRVMLSRAGDGRPRNGIRNGWSVRRTERA